MAWLTSEHGAYLTCRRETVQLSWYRLLGARAPNRYIDLQVPPAEDIEMA
jgi:hypothetical protein